MGKKSKIKALQKKNANDDSDVEDDGGTVAESMEDGMSTPVRTKAGVPSRLIISEAVEKLSEKRFTTRESGLEQLIKHFQTSYDSTEDLSIDSYQETILTQLLRSIRRPPSLKEGKLCTHLLCLLGLYLGADEVEFFTNVEKPLRQLIDGTRPELVEMRGNALSCLSFLAFICGGVDAGYRTWEYCARILRHEDPTVPIDVENSNDDSSSDTSDSDSSIGEKPAKDSLAQQYALQSAAATSWVLLSTLRTPEEVLQRCMGDSFSLLDPLLELLQYHDTANPGSMDIKIAAGKSVAYLWEVAASGAPVASEPEVCGALLCDDPNTVHNILEIVKQVAKDSSKRISKKDRKEQRTEFRAVDDLIFKGEAPTESARMQGAVIEVNSFQELLVVEALRGVLGSGFHSSLRLFSVVKEVLGVEYVTSDMDGAGHDLKVNKGSTADKSRSNCRKQDRRSRQMETDFGDGDYGDD